MLLNRLRRMRTPSEPLDYQLLIVKPVLPAPALNVSRRKRTPKLEAEMPHDLAIVCQTSEMPKHVSGTFDTSIYGPLAPEKELFPVGRARVVAHVAYKPDSQDEPFEVLVTYPVRHIILPFNLREDPASFSKDVNRLMIKRLIPNTVDVWFDGLTLILYMSHMPSHAFPETIAGVPVYFTQDTDDTGPIPIGLSLEGAQVTDLAGSTFEDTLDVAAQYFTKNDIPVLEFHLWDERAIVVLKDDIAERHLLPTVLASRDVFYIFENDARHLQTVSLHSQSVKWLEAADSSVYDNLQPGVILSSGKNPAESRRNSGGTTELLSSSGVMVTGKNGDRFMTVSTSYCPYDVNVFHPTMNSQFWRSVGEIVCELLGTDISLVKLKANEVMNNQPFQNTLIEQLGIASLQDFLPTEAMTTGMPIYINAPATGYRRGALGPSARVRLNAHDAKGRVSYLRWVRVRLVYFGLCNPQTNSAPGGMAGTPVWDKMGHVLGVVRGNRDGDIVLKHWTYMIPAECLTELGYSLTIEGATNPAGVGRRNSPEAMLY